MSILAVAFIGGVIVLYVYVSSVAQNEMTTFNPFIILLIPTKSVTWASNPNIPIRYSLSNTLLILGLLLEWCDGATT